MKRWIVRGVVLSVLAFGMYATYDSYRGGYFNLPDLPDGAYPISFKNGLRAIVLDAEVEDPSMRDTSKYLRRLTVANPDRKYLGVPLEVEPWFRDAWSWCKSPTAEEQVDLERWPDDLKRSFANARFEAVCRIEVDGSDLIRGLIFSVPKALLRNSR